MGSNDLVQRSDGQTVQSADVNQYRTALNGDLVPRNSSGVPVSAAGDLGTSALPFNNVRFNGNLIQGGVPIDLSSLTSGASAYQIISGEARTSGYPNYLQAVGSTTTGRIEASATNLELSINGTSVSLNSDIDVTGLTTAPASNNTCLVNDSTLAGGTLTKVLGEYGESITIDTIGSEISSLDGSVQAFKKGNEVFLAYVDTSNNKLYPFIRGYCRTDRETLTDNDTITLLQANWIFLDQDGSSTYKTTILPTFESDDPASATSNQWYFDVTNQTWKQYSGTWTAQDAILLGAVVCDDTDAIQAQPLDFDVSWGDDLIGTVRRIDNDTVRVMLNRIAVAGTIRQQVGYGQEIQLSVSDDRESGISEAAGTTFYIYCDTNLKLRFSDKAPRPTDRKKGLYHPAEYWRYIGYALNDSSSNISYVAFDNSNNSQYDNPSTVQVGKSRAAKYVDASQISYPTIDTLDSTGTHHIYKATATTLDISGAGMNGAAQSDNLTGTVSVTSASATITGSGTTFTTDFEVGDVIAVNGSETLRIETITSNILMTAESNFSTTVSGETYKRGGEAPNSIYATYYIDDGGTVGVIASTRDVAAGDTLVDLPDGVRWFKQAPYFFTNDPSSDQIPFFVAEGGNSRPVIMYDIKLYDSSSCKTNVLAVTTSATSFTDLDLSLFVPKSSKVAMMHAMVLSTADTENYLKAKGGSTDGLLIQNYTNNNFPQGIFRIPTDDNQVIQYKSSRSTSDFWANVAGYIPTELAA
jgi:hypothetical protein